MTGRKLNERRKQLGLSIEDVAQKSNLTKSTVEKVLFGVVKHPRIDTVQAIERALELDNFKPLSWFEQINQLNLEDYNLLSDKDKEKIAEIFNTIVTAFKEK